VFNREERLPGESAEFFMRQTGPVDAKSFGILTALIQCPTG